MSPPDAKMAAGHELKAQPALDCNTHTLKTAAGEASFNFLGFYFRQDRAS
jgi:hypothetical protein